MDKQFEIRTYGYNELAQLYFPNVTKSSASRMFGLWINASKWLKDELIQLNWQKRQKYFTPKQVKAIIAQFDPPF